MGVPVDEDYLSDMIRSYLDDAKNILRKEKIENIYDMGQSVGRIEDDGKLGSEEIL